jgi:hypothetical protein
VIRRPGRTGWIVLLFVALAATGGIVASQRLSAESQFVREAYIRAGVSEDLLQGHSRGRQGLIGSLYYSPLPTLLALPLFRLPRPLGGEWAFVVLGILSAAALGTAASYWFRRNGAPMLIGLAAALGIFLSPHLCSSMLDGSSRLLSAALLFAVFCFLLNWLSTRHIRSLAYLSLGLMLALITRYQAALLVLAALVIVPAALLPRYRPRHYVEGTLVVLIAPPVYAALLWITSNWLIMGDPWFFARGVGALSRFASKAWYLFLEGSDWRFALLALTAALLPWMAGGLSGKRRTAAAGMAAILVAIPFWLPWTGEAPVTDFAGAELREQVLPTLRTGYADDWIVISGYRGYGIGPAGAKLPANVQHTLSFYLKPILDDTHERRAFLLTPRPVGPDRWEDVNLKFPGIYENGTAFTVYERSWEHWRLWRLVRLDPTDRQ